MRFWLQFFFSFFFSASLFVNSSRVCVCVCISCTKLFEMLLNFEKVERIEKKKNRIKNECDGMKLKFDLFRVNFNSYFSLALRNNGCYMLSNSVSFSYAFFLSFFFLVVVFVFKMRPKLSFHRSFRFIYTSSMGDSLAKCTHTKRLDCEWNRWRNFYECQIDLLSAK